MTREEAISETFNDFLDRYSPPRHMASNPKAMQAEADALLRAVMKFAPRSGYEAWLQEVLERIAYQMKTRAWPIIQEVAACASAVSRDSKQPLDRGESEAKTPAQIAADRIHAGDPVGDGRLYGVGAVELIESGLITESELKGHRSALFFAMKKNWGEEKARAVEAQLIDRHAKALEVAKDDGRRFGAPVPDKTADKSRSFIGGAV